MMPFSYSLFNDKSRNTVDENIFRLCGVQTLSRLVEITGFEPVTYALRARSGSDDTQRICTANRVLASVAMREQRKKV